MNYEMNYSSTSLGEEIERGERKRENMIMRKKNNAASLSKTDCIELMKENQSFQLAQVFSVIKVMSYYELLIVFIWL